MSLSCRATTSRTDFLEYLLFKSVEFQLSNISGETNERIVKVSSRKPTESIVPIVLICKNFGAPMSVESDWHHVVSVKRVINMSVRNPFICQSNLRLAHNGFGLCVRAGFGAENCQPALNLDRSTKLQVCTSARLTQNPCYQPFFLTTSYLYGFSESYSPLW